jgi:hypothetical protein
MAHINSSQWQRESATLCFTKGKETVTCCCICHYALKNGETGLGREAQALKIENEIERVNMTSLEGPIPLSNPPWILVRLGKRKYW